MPGLSDFLFGSNSKLKPYNQQGLNTLQGLSQGGGLNQNPLYQQGNSFLMNLLSGDPEAFKSFEAPFMQQFEQQTLPTIAERFAGMGTGAGASSSSGLFNSLAQAGKSLSTDLAGLRSGLQMQALPQSLQYSQQPIQNILASLSQIPGQFYEKPGQGGFLQGLSPLFGQLFSNSYFPGVGGGL